MDGATSIEDADLQVVGGAVEEGWVESEIDAEEAVGDVHVAADGGANRGGCSMEQKLKRHLMAAIGVCSVVGEDSLVEEGVGLGRGEEE